MVNTNTLTNRCACQWLLICDECAPQFKAQSNPCVNCKTLIDPVTKEDVKLLDDIGILAYIASELCYLDDTYHSNNVPNFNVCDSFQLWAVLQCAERSDIRDIIKNKDEAAHIFDLIDTLPYIDNTGLQNAFLDHFRNLIPNKKRPRNEDDATLNCWVRKGRVKCICYALPPRNVVRLALATDSNGIVRCSLSMFR